MGRGKAQGARRKNRLVKLEKADPVLIRRVRDIIAAGPSENEQLLTSEWCWVTLMSQHPEYKRSVQEPLKKVIRQLILDNRKALDAASVGGGQGSNGESSESEVEDAPDVHNMLNASLYDSSVSKRPRVSDEESTDAAKSVAEGSSSLLAMGKALGTPVTGNKNASCNTAHALRKKEEAALANLKKRKRVRGNGQKDSSSALQQDQNPLFSNKNTSDVQAERPLVRFSDMGGIDSCLQDVRELCSYPLTHPEIYRHLGVDPPRGILLHGPPGCGKTMLARAIAGEMGVSFFSVSAPEMVSGMSGESEEKVRALFETAKRTAPSIVFIDEIDAITGKRDSSSRGMERRIVAQLLTCMDSLQTERQGKTCATHGDAMDQGNAEADDSDNTSEAESDMQQKTVLVLGATNRPDSLDPALRRAGRFDREIPMGIPDAPARARILSCIAGKMRLTGDFSFEEIARITPGYVGADLDALAKEAAVVAVNRVFSQLLDSDVSCSENITALEKRTMAGLALEQHSKPFDKEKLASVFVTMSDFLEAVKKVQPSAKREGFATVPNVTWSDIGSLSSIREELSMAITEPIKNPERFRRMGLSAPAGVLLYGPPGCGKTLLAKAIANSSGSNFISVKGPELLNKYVGESERAVRQVFSRARSSAPCVVFFDELDSLCPRRGSDGSNGVSERVVNQLLTEMDGLEERRNVFVVAATNRPDIIDPAMLRPGRLDKLLFVPLPEAQDRVDILTTCARNSPVAENVCLEEIACRPELNGYTGADLAALIKEAAVHALRRIAQEGAGDGQEMIEQVDFDSALNTVLPSVSAKDRNLYQKMTSDLRMVKADGNSSHKKGTPAKLPE